MTTRTRILRFGLYIPSKSTRKTSFQLQFAAFFGDRQQPDTRANPDGARAIYRGSTVKRIIFTQFEIVCV